MVPSTTALTLNMQLPNIATVAWAVQGDVLARHLEATLVDGSTAWNPPTGADGVVRYFKPDGTNGVYDVDEDGNPAVTWSGNVATITIVQQALTVPGTVKMQLDFYDTDSTRLSTFGWVMNVEPSAVTDNEFLSSDYYNILSIQIAAVLEAAGGSTPGTSLPLMDGIASAGSSPPYSREDHVHPTDTSRASATDVADLQATVANKVLYLTSVTVSATTGDIVSYSNAAITANHVVVECIFDDPGAVSMGVTWSTTAGTLTISGTCSSATTANIVLVKKDN